MTYDLALWHIHNDDLIMPAAPSEQYITGIEKLAQQVLIELFNEYGTVKYSLGHIGIAGSSFLTWLHTGQILSEMDLFSRFMMASAQVKDWIIANERVTDPPDERLKDIQLLNIVIQRDHVRLQIEITSHVSSIVLWALIKQENP